MHYYLDIFAEKKQNVRKKDSKYKQPKHNINKKRTGISIINIQKIKNL